MEENTEVDNPKTDNPEVAGQQTNATQQPVGLTPKLTMTESTHPKWLIPVLTIAVVLSLGTVGYFAYQNYQIKQQSILALPSPTPIVTLPTSAPTPATDIPTATPKTTISNWETYTNASAGFSIKHPAGWRRVETENLIGFGPQEIGEDTVWGVTFYGKDQVGKQFSDRRHTGETTSFNGLTATKLITTTGPLADWYRVEIIIDSGNMLYEIGNSAQTDKALNEMISIRTGKSSDISFEDFYTSFKIIE